MAKKRDGEMTQSSLSQFFFDFTFVTSCSHMTLFLPKVSSFPGLLGFQNGVRLYHFPPRVVPRFIYPGLKGWNACP